MSSQVRVEECLAPLRWVKRWHPVPGSPELIRQEHVLQQEWRVTLGGYHPNTGVFIPADVRTEWRDVPTVNVG
jgi:hypothetical protein